MSQPTPPARHSTRALALLGLLAASAAPAWAQDNAAAGLFVGEARQLPLVSQSLVVEIRGDEARLHLTQDFLNDGEAEGQADYQLFLPEGATVEGFGFWSDDRFFEAELQEKGEAEARHRQAAEAGRTTGLLEAEDQLHSFSVYPVPAGAIKRVESTLRLPVETDLGRQQLRLPVDRFLGQAGPDSTVFVDLHTLEPLRGLDLTVGDWITLASSERQVQVAFSTDTAQDLSWWEERPPLLLRAERVPLEDDAVGLQVRVSLDDAEAAGLIAGGEAASPGPVHLFVDGSFSMQRRQRAVSAVRERVRQVGGEDAVIHEVSGHSLTWTHLEEAMAEAGCGGGGLRCVVLSDAQLEDLPDSRQANVEILLLADPHEKAWMPDRAAAALVYQEDVEPLARLRSLTDEAVLPVLELDALLLGGELLGTVGSPRTRVAEGGGLKLYALPGEATGDTLQVLARMGDRPLRLEVPLETLDRESPEGEAARRGWYRAELARLMARYREAPDEALKGAIVDLSLREGIPTAFTALQVDDPELSLVAIKPGDPVLTVHGEAGLAEVAAWYPFGDARRLVREEAGADGLSDFSDRFLVPRRWEERAYRVEVFKGFADGSQRREQVWYYLDEQAPTVSLRLDAGALLVEAAGPEAADIGSVRVQAEGREWALERDGEAGPWRLPLAALPLDEVVVLVRDRAGNRSVLRASLTGGELAVRAEPRPEGAAAGELPWSEEPVAMTGPRTDGVRLVQEPDGRLVVSAPEVWARSAEALTLRSLVVTSHLGLPEGGALVGTRGGELLHVDRAGAVELLDLDTPEHPVTGLALLPDGTVLVGILGEGLREWDGRGLRASRHDLGSAFVTGLHTLPGGLVLAGTAYNGLWRIGERGAWKTRFPSDHVTSLEEVDGALRVRSGLTTWRRAGLDRYEVAETAGNGLPQRAPDLTAAVRWRDEVVVAGFDTGLWRLTGDPAAGAEALTSLPVDLSAAESRINDLVVHEGLLWLATEGGVVVVDPVDLSPRRLSEAPAMDLDAVDDAVAVATSAGLLVFTEAGASPLRLDIDAEGAVTAGSGKWMSVAWQGEGLYAGGMEGLVRFAPEAAPVTVDEGFPAHWITTLLATPEGLYVGTYADGVWRVDEGDAGVLRAAPVAGLEQAWVPPRGLALVDGVLHVGGIGEAARVVEPSGGVDDGVRRLRLPARDVNAFLPLGSGRVLVLTSDGIAVSGASPLVRAGR